MYDISFDVLLATRSLLLPAICSRRKANKPFADSTAIGEWALIELSIEILCACLPTMTPFLHIRTHCNQLRSGFPYRKSRGSSSDAGNDSQQQLKRPNVLFKDSIQYRPNSFPGSVNTATVSAVPRCSRDLDDIPLRSILVKKDLDWTEERTVPRASLGSREVGDMA